MGGPATSFSFYAIVVVQVHVFKKYYNRQYTNIKKILQYHKSSLFFNHNFDNRKRRVLFKVKCGLWDLNMFVMVIKPHLHFSKDKALLRLVKNYSVVVLTRNYLSAIPGAVCREGHIRRRSAILRPTSTWCATRSEQAID